MLSRPADRHPAALLKRWLFVVLALSVALAGFHHFGHAHEHHVSDAVVADILTDGSVECCVDTESSQPNACLSACASVCGACVPITEHVRLDGRLVAPFFPALAAVHPRSYHTVPFRPPRFA